NTCATLTTVKGSRDEFKQTIVVDVSRGCDDEIAVRELAGMKSDGCLVIEGGNCFACPFDWPSKRVIRKVGSIEEFAQKFVGGVLDHLHLFENHFLLPLEVFLIEPRAGHEIGEQVHGFRQGRIRNLYREACHLMGRISVKMAAELVSFHGDIASAAVPG